MDALYDLDFPPALKGAIAAATSQPGMRFGANDSMSPLIGEERLHEAADLQASSCKAEALTSGVGGILCHQFFDAEEGASQAFRRVHGAHAFPTDQFIIEYFTKKTPDVIIRDLPDTKSAITWGQNEVFLSKELVDHLLNPSDPMNRHITLPKIQQGSESTICMVTILDEAQHALSKSAFAEMTTPPTATPGTVDWGGNGETGYHFEKRYFGFILAVEIVNISALAKDNQLWGIGRALAVSDNKTYILNDDLVRKMMDCIEQTTPFYFDSNQLQFAAPPATDSVFWRTNGAPKQAPARAQSTGLSPSRRKVDIRACGRIYRENREERNDWGSAVPADRDFRGCEDSEEEGGSERNVHKRKSGCVDKMHLIPGTGLGTRSETRNVKSPSDKDMTY
ncbi:hypothetical protein B0H13DRAFT_1926399 [Mycena leptocephala]|nr:hypothetical protein B0H13DRAFT_1926399 [Mycena leptocephala]